MKIKALVNDEFITVGKSYNVLHTYFNQVLVVNDRRLEKYYKKDIFEGVVNG